MISAELLARKLQEILGAQYKCVPFHLYLSGYTQPIQTPTGVDFTIDAQAFELDKGFIPCIVKCMEQQPNSAPYIAKSLIHEITFSVPQNVNKFDGKGILLEKPEFDFFADYLRLIDAVRFKELTFDVLKEVSDSLEITGENYDGFVAPDNTDVYAIWKHTPSIAPAQHSNSNRYQFTAVKNMADTYNIEQNDGITKVTMYVSREELDEYPGINPNIQFENYINDKGAAVFEWGGIAQVPQYKGWLTISEPSMIGREYDKQQRLLWRITGNFEIYDEDIRTGKDIKICVVLGGEEYEFTNPANISFNSDRNGQSAQTAEGLSNKLVTSTKSNTVSFAVEDVGDGPAINLLRDLADKNPDSVETTAEVKHRKSKVNVITYRNSSERRRFWAIPVVVYSAAGVSSVGVFSVSFIDDGMEE